MEGASWDAESPGEEGYETFLAEVGEGNNLMAHRKRSWWSCGSITSSGENRRVARGQGPATFKSKLPTGLLG